MLLQKGPLAIAEFAELEQLFADGGDVGRFGVDGCTECNRHRIRNFPRPALEQTPAGERENRAPQMIRPNWHDRSVSLPRDQLVAALQAQQGAGTRDLSFRNKTNNFPGAN